MGKTYRVCFNSAVNTPIVTAPDNQFFFNDWSQIPEGRYKCYWSLTSQTGQRQQFYTTCMVFMDLGQTGVFFADRSALRGSGNVPFGAEYYNSTFIGCLENMNTRTAGNPSNGGYIARTETNPPFYLDKRPNNNRVNIRWVEGTASLTSGTLFGYNPGNYTLTLYLELQD